jgi:hypothetical protein
MENHLFEGIFSPILAANGSQFTPLRLSTDNIGKPPPAKTAAPDDPYKEEPWMNPEFLDTLIELESKGDPKARGDLKNGVHRAWGILQERPPYVDQANKIRDKWGNPNNDAETQKRFGSYAARFKDAPKFTYNDRDNPERAKQIFRINMQDLYNQFVDRHGRPPSTLEMASLHHLGLLEGNESDSKYQAAYQEADVRVKTRKAEEAKKKASKK